MPLGIRYRVPNADGSISTVRTISVGVDGGEALIPTVINGRIVSDDEAYNHYLKTGEHFGIFKTPDDATAYANWLHKQHETEMGRPQYPDPLKGPGTVTSMRRTPEGNRLVGGVPNSAHLTGEAVDIVGATEPEIRAFYGPNAKIGWHKNHFHTVVPGAKFPYYGKRGTTGLK